ncbi:PorP/SprF family type IX secretion system membrane protein [Fulvivirga lutea]|uniref:PorP/SprF family type IX secretion system membrane protein n=1 Tax=Fulvivirga lutea TaxID=2810512 RepID=A0A974WGY5_9BACT|nr:PorP/SprF family type IX secretion system membrane protein [Fulvivirga lutea]QSE97875.1 PorP/SprF family type IX secretion system membrane protein [Fulvivirga lutea]
MIKHLLKGISVLLITLSTTYVDAQDIPLFSQKLTNSFIYNPAMAGHTFGSLTLANRRNFSNVNGAAENNFLSFHTPFYDHRFGVGANVFREQVNFVDNIYASGAFAYHINFGSYNVLSMGVSAEYNSIGFDINSVIGDRNDPLLGEKSNNMDFSFGINYQHRYFKVGAAANRLATNLELSNNASVLSEFYSGYAAGLIPLRGGLDILEPTFTFRKLSAINDIWETGLYYTFNNLLTVGSSYRKGDILNAAVGLKVAKKFFVGYSYEIVNNNLGTDVGPSSEIAVRFDFNDKSYQERFRQDYKNSLAFRRKTLSTAAKRTRVGSRSPKSFKKRQKSRLKNIKSPNQRYNNLKKLPKVERRKFDNKKRRKKNYKRRKQKRYKSNKRKRYK